MGGWMKERENGVVLLFRAEGPLVNSPVRKGGAKRDGWVVLFCFSGLEAR
ncbi:MAG: hypothetical protein M3Y56_07035 [Armatimonadota bacterium]|nr:hypothetical protein [Armatimonadota bacterium]